MDMSPGISNYTPLNLNRFQPSKKRFHVTDLFLVLSVISFLLSISYYVGNSKFYSNSQAANRLTPVTRPTGSNVKYPKSYKDERIPQTIFVQVKNSLTDFSPKEKDEKAKDIVMRYYAYKDVLAENELASESSELDSKSLPEEVSQMEQIIAENLLSTADFGYVHARFKYASNEAELQNLYGNLKERAKSLTERYVELFNNSSYTVKQIVDVANKDEELSAINEGRDNQYLKNYTSIQGAWQKDKDFHKFLFEQEPKKISDIYTLKVDGDKPFAYLVVYVDKVEQKKYYSADQILEEKITQFVY